jgi:hypothetical protein
LVTDIVDGGLPLRHPDAERSILFALMNEVVNEEILCIGQPLTRPLATLSLRERGAVKEFNFRSPPW